MGNNLLLSICIPTNGVVEWIIPAINSIYSQGVDNNEFEVVVTDNGEKDDLEIAVSQFEYPNFHYYRTNSRSFENQIDAFEKCSGVFCKMLNHRSKMLPGSIFRLLEVIKKYKEEKPIIYCAEGHVKGGEYVECENVDKFVRSLNYFISWSAGTGVWKEDLKDVRKKKIDKMFPHIVFLLGLRNESKYVIWNQEYEQMGDDSGKGGYDLFDTFAVHFLDIINGLLREGRIQQKTFYYVKKKLLRFLVKLYKDEVVLPTKHTFILQNIRRNVKTYYGNLGFYMMVVCAYLLVVKQFLFQGIGIFRK